MSSLAEITIESDLVIRGTIRDAYSDWRGGDAYDSYANVSIEEVLKGVPESREADTVDVGIGYLSSPIDGLRSSLPEHDHLWFLIRDEDRHGTYYTTDYVQVSVLRDIGGVVEVIRPEAIGNAYSPRQFPVPLDGTSFEELVDQVRQLVEGQSAAMHELASWSPNDEPDPNRFAAC